MTYQQSAELTQPGVGSLDDPAAFVAAQLASIFMLSVATVFAIRHD